jgi:hypothetical protein
MAQYYTILKTIGILCHIFVSFLFCFCFRVKQFPFIGSSLAAVFTLYTRDQETMPEISVELVPTYIMRTANAL